MKRKDVYLTFGFLCSLRISSGFPSEIRAKREAILEV